MNKKCLYCYKSLDKNDRDFHRKCYADFFGTPEPPAFNYSLSDMAELAKKVVERHISVPGVQPKLSLGLGGNYIFKPPSDHFSEMPGNEHLSMRMAEASEFRLLTRA